MKGFSHRDTEKVKSENIKYWGLIFSVSSVPLWLILVLGSVAKLNL